LPLLVAAAPFFKNLFMIIEEFVRAVDKAYTEHKESVNDITLKFLKYSQSMTGELDLLIVNFNDDVQKATDEYKKAVKNAYKKAKSS
jgi:hypothetical protein